MTARIRRTAARFVDREPGRLTHHALSFGSAYDPDWVSFGPMVCHDDHLLGAGRGFDEHPHAGLEILTWVVSGTVLHRDDTGARSELPAGTCGLLSAGSGVHHSEHATEDGPARFVQVWLTPDDATGAPHHDHVTVAPDPGEGLVPLVGADGPLRVGTAGTSYAVARLGAGEQLTLPSAPRVHLYVVSGALGRSSMAEPLQAGDAFFLDDESERTVTAGVPTEVLVWTFG